MREPSREYTSFFLIQTRESATPDGEIGDKYQIELLCYFRAVAQLGARLFWKQEVVGSKPTSPILRPLAEAGAVCYACGMSIARGWYYLVEPEAGRWAPPARRLETPHGRILTVRHHGHPGRVEVVAPHSLPMAARIRAARAVGESLSEPVQVWVDQAGEGVQLALSELQDPSPWPLEAVLSAQFQAQPPPPLSPVLGSCTPIRRILFFESLMNAEMPHNDAEISQGVLHMISALQEMQVEVVLANVKMAIIGTERPVQGLETLATALEAGPIDIVCITLLEGYWEGVISLIRELRRLGCRAHIALGGVMPTLSPEHVAAHIPDASFICRGAGEYFVPRLAAIMGESSVDTPFTPAQVSALLAMDGLIALDRAGGRLVSANSAKIMEVDDLDKVALDLRYITTHHLSTGVELSTSRGCLHRCTFCSIIGRESYQARSAEGIFELLGRYHAYYQTLFGDAALDARGRNTAAPRNAYRVHISDDDFACDRERLIAFFKGLLQTPFRLSSCQVSIGDLCQRVEGKLLAEPDLEILAVMTAECFDDYGAAIPPRDFVADHRSRAWSSYLQIGVESFSDRELARLGKGYQRAHIRAIVAALAARGIHHDAYFILSNAETTAKDLVDVLDEVVRLKLQYPLYFHLRFPVVPHLVSYFPSASYRRNVRQGQETVSQLRALATIQNYPELDYPFVDHDMPRDPLVRAAVESAFFTDQDYYSGAYVRLRAQALARWAAEGDPEAAYLARVLDDRLRRRLFEVLEEARQKGRGSPEHPADPRPEAHIRRIAETYLGPIATWLTAFQRHAQGGVTRLVVIPTWQCELRCGYCYIPKQDGRVMQQKTLEQAIDLLLSSERQSLTLQFFGGEALLEWPLIQHGIRWGSAQAAKRGRRLDFVLSSNGWSLNAERLQWLKDWPVKLELSLDGDAETQRRSRPARQVGVDSYAHSIAPQVQAIVDSGLLYDVIMVVHPQFVERLSHNYLHIADLGFKRVQINIALGKAWTVAQSKHLASQLFILAAELRKRPNQILVNAEHAPMPMRLNGEITVDWDGTIYGGNAFLHETEHKERFKVGHLQDLMAFDRYWMDAPANAELVAWSYPPDVTSNNLKVGAILSDFLRWYRSQAGMN